ncbi:MAG: hypothetical protein KAV00_06900 [Phycisphaerae bacterium]|nr:hypothetical protein [Phycisphaerae bacterium]
MAAGDTYLIDSGGETLLHTDGATATHEDCCCSPCVQCDGLQNDSAVITTDAPAGYCHIDGTYIYSVVGGSCPYYWGDVNYYALLHVNYDAGADKWSGTFYSRYALVIQYQSSDVSGISCNSVTGKLEGTFTLPGVGACAGYTATVTL